MNNIYNIFPKDIWILIILEIPCKYIYNLSDANDQFKELCINENIIEKRKFKGFPRKSGHCEVFNVSNYEGNVYYENNILVSGNFADILETHRYINIKAVKLIFSEILDRLYYHNFNLIKGDLIDCKHLIFIFDGEEIILTNYNTNYKTKKIYTGYFANNYSSILPYEFNLIKYNIPSKYWNGRGLGDDTAFYFNCRDYKTELINKIIYDENHKLYRTEFISNDKTYIIMFKNNFFYGSQFSDVKNLLSKNNNLLLNVNLTQQFDKINIQDNLFVFNNF